MRQGTATTCSKWRSIARATALSLLVLLFVAPADAYPIPTIPRERIESVPSERLRGLIAKLYSHDDQEVVKAIAAMAAMGDEAAAAAPYLASMMNTKHPRGPNEAAAALVRIGPAAVEPVILALEMGDRYAKRRAAEILGKLGDPRAIPALVAAVADENRAHDSREALRQIGLPARKYLIERMQSKDTSIRRKVVPALPSFADKSTFAMLIGELDADDALARERALEAMLLMLAPDRHMPQAEGVEAGPWLNKAIDDSDPRNRRLALRIIRHLPPSELGRKILEKAVEDADDSVRLVAMDVAVSFGGDTGVALLAPATTSKDEAIRAHAVQNLARINHPDALKLLRQLADADSPMVRQNAVEGLARQRQRKDLDLLIKAMSDRDPLVRLAGTFGVGGIRSDASEQALIKALADIDPIVRIEAAKGLAAFYTGKQITGNRQDRPVPATDDWPLRSKRSFDAMTKALDDKDDRVRQVVVSTWADHRDARAAEIMLRMLGDNDRDILREALGYIVRRGQKVPKLGRVRELAEHWDRGVRSRAIQILGRQKDEASKALFVKGLSDHRDVSRSAAEALRLLGDAGVEPLFEALDHPSHDTRSAVTAALLDYKRDDIRQRLAKLAKGGNQTIANRMADDRNAKRSAEEIAMLIRQASQRDQDRLAGELANRGEAGIKAASDLLNDDQADVRRTSIRALGAMQNPKAIPALARALKDEHPLNRAAAANGLGRTANERAIKPLVDALDDEDEAVRESALDALVALGKAEATDPIARLTEHNSWRTRGLALEALRRLPPTDHSLAAARRSLPDPHWFVRGQAAATLGALKDGASLEALVAARSDDHWYVRSRVAEAIQSIKATPTPTSTSKSR